MRRLLRSRWLWLAICVAAGAAAVTISDWLVLRQALQLADAFAGSGNHPEAPRTYTVSILFGWFTFADTQTPYLWFTLGSVLTGGVLGFAAWALVQAGLWIWRRVRRRGSTA